jgi:radical SAM superfamily enzyme YgiQ (UPF0313 family)
MKILFSYPPLDLSKGYPTLGQNRQFQYFNAPTFIYPVVPAVAATMLKNDGHRVIWNDCIAEGMDRASYFDFVRREKPDLIVFESKTPVIKEHWSFINALKKELLASNVSLLTVLTGDHVTALPEESFRNSAVDFVLTGGDYDFLLRNLCRHLGSKLSTMDHGLSTPLEPGIWRRENGRITNSGPFMLNHDLDRAPFIDRELTRWGLYAYENGNYRRTPGTYIMSGRDCWWGRCSFCSWTRLYPEFRSRSVDNVLDEIGRIIRDFPVKEIMDDTGTFPRGDWLRDFCRGIVERGYRRFVGFDCNFRFGAASLEEYRMMAKAGFRFLLFGLESGNGETLDRLNKGITVEEIIDSCRLARHAGLYPHVTIMFGYPWEGYEQARKTYELGRYLLRKGYAYTMQATIVIPYPGTRLYGECLENGWLLTSDWSDFDMRRPVMRIPFPERELLGLVRKLYSVAFDPLFLWHKVLSIRDRHDLKFFSRAGRKVFGHLRDFAGRRSG